VRRPPSTAASVPCLSALVARHFVQRPAGGADQESGCLPTALADDIWHRVLLGPAHDFLRRPGKQLRARLCTAAWSLAGGDPGGPPPELPALVELFHAGSLIIDDIEDGSRERRGDFSLHVRHGLPVALNTGNWLYFVALDLIGRLPLPAEARFSLYRAASTTLVSCHQGQALDLALTVGAVPAYEIAGVVAMTTRLKTASLMELAATMGALAAGGAAAVVTALGAFGGELGIGLQMLDDLSGLGAAKRHKGREDLRLLRLTWPWAWLAEDNPARVGDLLSRLHEARCVSGEMEEADAAIDRVCEALAGAIGERGRGRARQLLGAAWQRLAAAVGPSDTLDSLGQDIAGWEESMALRGPS
jgi:geranylgeranyl pyrophosphate synthase